MFVGERPSFAKASDGRRILYVGRATLLRRRILQYFPSTSLGQAKLDARISEMVALAKDVKYQETDTLLDAVVLEANLIKKYWPKYNVKDRDDRSFIYIVIDKGADYPKPIVVRGKELQKFSAGGAEVFGPYQSLTVVRNALKIIRRIFPYSTCLPAGSPANPFPGKPCFDYQVGLCPGICVGAILKDNYRKNINDIILLLSGQKKKLIKVLQKENPDKAAALKHIQDVALISQEEAGMIAGAYKIEGYDISHLNGKETYGSMVVFIDGKPDKNHYRIFKIKEAPANDDLRALEEMLSRRLRHSEWLYPDLVMIDGGKPQVDFIYEVFQKKHLNIPLVGISKYQNDKLVFPLKTKKAARDLIHGQKIILLKIRDEAHRFALKASRRKRRTIDFSAI